MDLLTDNERCNQSVTETHNDGERHTDNEQTCSFELDDPVVLEIVERPVTCHQLVQRSPNLMNMLSEFEVRCEILHLPILRVHIRPCKHTGQVRVLAT